MNLNKRVHSETAKENFLAFPDFPSLLAFLWLNQSKLARISRSPGCPGAGVVLGALSIAQGPGACSRPWGSPPSTTTANWFVARGLASDLGSICLTDFPQKEAVRKWCVGWNTAACTPWLWSQPSPHKSARGSIPRRRAGGSHSEPPWFICTRGHLQSRLAFRVLSTSVTNGISCKCNLSWFRCVFQGRCCVAQKLAVLA